MFGDGRAYYKTQHWKDLCRACKRRDGYRCTSCGAEPHKSERYRLHAHHKISRPEIPFPTELDVLSNVVTLCEECHQAEHPGRRIAKTSTSVVKPFKSNSRFIRR